MLEISDLKAQNSTGVITMRATVHNQHNELVLEGMHRYLIRKARGLKQRRDGDRKSASEGDQPDTEFTQRTRSPADIAPDWRAISLARP